MSDPGRREHLERELGDRLRDLSLAAEHIGHRFAARNALHVTDFRALTLIYSAEESGHPLTPSRLAATLGLTSSAATYLVERLVASGHVRRDTDPADRRRVLLRYADFGREVAVGFFRPLAFTTHDAVAGYTDDELHLALDVLGDLTSSLVAYEATLGAH